MNRNNKFTLISCVSACIAAIAACVSIMQTAKILEEQKLSKKPYFIISESRITKNDEDTQYIIHLTLKNIGEHPATLTRGDIKPLDFISCLLKKQPHYYSNFTLGEDIESQDFFSLNYELKNLRENDTKGYIIFTVWYKDPYYNKEYQKEFYLVWEKAKGQKLITSLAIASAYESGRVKESIRDSQ